MQQAEILFLVNTSCLAWGSLWCWKSI